MATHDIAEDDLELYAPDWLPELDAAPVEEHLLVCEDCRARLTEWDDHIRVMREAMRGSRTVPTTRLERQDCKVR
jgi:anti-sigma factor RsiW